MTYKLLIGALLSITSFSAAAQPTSEVPRTIPNFKCVASLVHFAVNPQTNESDVIAQESIQLPLAQPTYILDRTEGIEFPLPKNLTGFKKFPVFAEARIVIFEQSKTSVRSPGTMDINLFGTFSNTENPTPTNPFPTIISTSSFQNVAPGGLDKTFSALYGSSDRPIKVGENYAYSVSCEVVK